MPTASATAAAPHSGAPSPDVTPASLWALSRQAVSAWIDDYAPSMGAAIAYYTVFSIAPLLLIVIALGGMLFGQEAVQGHIFSQIGGLIGKEGAVAIQGLLESAGKPGAGILATLISLLALVIGATSVFAELQSALDRIWRVPAPPQENGIWVLVRTRLLSFGLVLALGFLMMVSLVASAALGAFGKWFGGLVPGWELLFQVINTCLSFAVTAALFAMIYKIMPRARIAWRDVWLGAGLTAALFEIGKVLIGLYIGKTTVSSGLAAAGSLLVVLLWVYYSAQIFLLGAEFTWAFAGRHGSRVEVEAGAAPAIPEAGLVAAPGARAGAASQQTGLPAARRA